MKCIAPRFVESGHRDEDVSGAASVLYIYLAVKKVIKVPKILLIFHPICIYALSKIIGILILTFTKDDPLKQLFAGGASFGCGLMFLGRYIAAVMNPPSLRPPNPPLP